MALIKCPECKKKVSDQCDRCPSCGYPIAANLDAVEPNKDYFAMATAFIKRMIDFIRKRKQVRIALIVTCAALAILTIVGIVVYNAVLPKTEAYEAAVELLEEGSYKDALQEFEELGTYKDSQEKANICKFQLALDLEASREYVEAAMLYKELGNYVHRYGEFVSKPIGAADKAKDAVFHQIAKDVRNDYMVGLLYRGYSGQGWHKTLSDYRYSVDELNNVVVTVHLYAYYNVKGNRVQDRDVELTSSIELADYEELLGLTDENYGQIEAEWLAFMKENYADGF